MPITNIDVPTIRVSQMQTTESPMEYNYPACYYYFTDRRSRYISNTQQKIVRQWDLWSDGNEKENYTSYNSPPNNKWPNRYSTPPPKLSHLPMFCDLLWNSCLVPLSPRRYTIAYDFDLNNVHFTFSCSSPYSNLLQILEMRSVLLSSTSVGSHTPSRAVPVMTPGLDAFRHCHGVALYQA